MKSESTMTPEQLENFRAINRRMGLHEDTVTDHTPPQALRASSGASNSGPVIYSGDPEKSHYTPLLITVNSIAEYNKMIGAPDDQNDSHVAYPEKLSNALKSRPAGTLSSEEHAVVQKAKYAYLHGNPAKVEEYESLINEHFFPKKVAYFADTDNLTISVPTQVSDNIPVVWNYNDITIDQNGSLTAVNTEFTVMANKLQSVGDQGGNGTDKIVESIGGVQDNPTAQPGPNGQTGPAGKQGTPAACGPDSSQSGTPTVCITPPGNGTVGLVGTNANDGTGGIKGKAQFPLNVTVAQTITGNLIIRGGGGIGQNGGPGGTGGPGGPGGAAGNNCTQCTAASPGNQGPGGNGGNGGAAGNGGDGAPINVTYSVLEGNLSAVYVGGQPGQAGQGGQGGTGGTGTTGSNGANGIPGLQSTITANGNPIQ